MRVIGAIRITSRQPGQFHSVLAGSAPASHGRLRLRRVVGGLSQPPSLADRARRCEGELEGRVLEPAVQQVSVAEDADRAVRRRDPAHQHEQDAGRRTGQRGVAAAML